MKYDRFEELPVWQDAAQFGADVMDWTEDRSFRGVGDLANQLQRAALSISNNIAEGFERGTTSELINFLYYARGSAGEVRSMLAVMQRGKKFQHLTTDIDQFKSAAESISRQIRGWTNSLQNSPIKGQKHLNDQTRGQYETRQRREQALGEHRRWREEFEATLKSKVGQQCEQQTEI